MYGMNRPKKTMTASARRIGHPQDHQEESFHDPVEGGDHRRAAQVAADPLERDVSGGRIVSRRHVLADAITQTQALSPSIRKKKVRKVARSPMVATVPMLPAIADA